MNSPSRDEMLQRLAKAAEVAGSQQTEAGHSVLLGLMRVVGVKLGHFVELCEVLGGGTWATARDPYAYVAKATKNTAQRQGRSDSKFLEIVDSEWLDACNWEGEGGADDFGSVGRGPSYRELVHELPAEFKTVRQPSPSWKSEIDRGNALSGPEAPYFHIGSVAIPNFGAWARTAGLSEWEQRALMYRAEGVSRDEALRKQPNDTARKALQAGYRQLGRRGFGHLKAAIPPRPRDRERRTSNEPSWYTQKRGHDPHPPKSVIAGITPARIMQAKPAFDPIPWWAAPVPRKK